MIKIYEEADCCGCAACASVCPTVCIELVPGTLGALFPKVDIQKCIQCGSCISVCPMKKEADPEKNPKQIAYAAYSKDSVVRDMGASGGLFPILALWVLRKGGSVYGAAFDERLKLRCRCVESEDDLLPLCKSKYLQCDMQGQFAGIEQKLQTGRMVLVTSTPCQIAALKSYLKTDYENLLCVDFFCHGVPSQEFFDACKSYIEKRDGISIVQYRFREKRKNGATPHYFSMKYIKNGQERMTTKLYFCSPFYAAFQKYVTLRESCYKCPFSGKTRFSDITIGDFHTIEKYFPGINRFEGISTVIINSEKGGMLFDSVKDGLWCRKIELEVLQNNGDCFCGSTVRPRNRDQFIEDYGSKSIECLIPEWFSVKRYWKEDIYYHLPNGIRKMLRVFFFGG